MNSVGKTTARSPATDSSEVLILPDGKILAHNISPVMAEVLAGLDPADEAMRRRAGQEQHPNHELSN